METRSISGVGYIGVLYIFCSFSCSCCCIVLSFIVIFYRRRDRTWYMVRYIPVQVFNMVKIGTNFSYILGVGNHDLPVFILFYLYCCIDILWYFDMLYFTFWYSISICCVIYGMSGTGGGSRGGIFYLFFSIFYLYILLCYVVVHLYLARLLS